MSILNMPDAKTVIQLDTSRNAYIRITPPKSGVNTIKKYIVPIKLDVKIGPTYKFTV